MKPNIDRRGRWARGITGTLCIIAGVALLLIGWPVNTIARWALAVSLILAGAFQLFEAKQSWCIARACGLKTPM